MKKKDTRSLVLAIVPLLAAVLLVLVWLGMDREGEAASPSEGMGVVAGSFEVVADPQRTPIPLDHGEPIPMTVYQSPTCGCCGLWNEHVEEHGFEVTAHMREDMGAVKESFAIRPNLASCHTAIVDGYVVEGHVPAEDIRRLLAEVPDARGLAVPGMPIGSPGMEQGDRVDPYEVLIFNDSGETAVWARHGQDGAED